MQPYSYMSCLYLQFEEVYQTTEEQFKKLVDGMLFLTLQIFLVLGVC